MNIDHNQSIYDVVIFGAGPERLLSGLLNRQELQPSARGLPSR